jgi:hypothetical protein
MTIIETIDVVMGAKTADLDKAIAKEIKNLQLLEKESNKSGGATPKGFDLPFGLSKTFAATALAAGGLAFEISQISKQLTAIDDTADAAKRLGTSFSDLKVLQLGLGESSGLGVDEINSAIQRMQVTLVEASRSPDSDISKQLGAVGLDPKKLLAEGTLDGFKELSNVIAGIGSQADQLAFATGVFGKNGAALVSSLRDGPDQLQEMAEFADKFGLLLTDAQAEMVGMANDSVGRLSMAFEGLQMQLSAEISPAITVIATDLLGIVGGQQDWNSGLTVTADILAYSYGVTKDLFELVTSTGAAFGSLLGGDLTVAAKQFNTAISLDQGFKSLEAVYEARKLAKEAAELTKSKRDSQKEHNGLVDKELEAQKKIREEIERQYNSKKDLLGSVEDEVAKLRASNDAGMRGEQFDSKAFEEKQKLEKLGKTGFDLQLDRYQRIRREEQAIADLIKQSFDLKEQFKDGDQRLVDEIRKLEELKRAGLIDQTIFDKAAKEAESATAPTDQRQGAVSVQQGSVAAYKLLLDRDNEATKIAKSQERLTAAMLGVMQEARDGINNIQPAKRLR